MITSNLISNISIAKSTFVKPEIGSGVTVCYHSDRHAGTITAYDEKRMIITLTEDDAKRIDNNGMSDMQDYEYTSNPLGRPYQFKFSPRKNRWVEVIKNVQTGRFNYSAGCGLIIGVRDSYHDFSF